MGEKRMRQILSTAAFLLFVVVFVGVANAQELPKVINGGVLNGKAIMLPKPAYPVEAKARRAEGPVSIKVTIDEEGNVIEAVPMPLKSTRKPNDDGSAETVEEAMPDPDLAEAARAAALDAKFSPTRLSGQPVKVTGIITYNFVAGDSVGTRGSGVNGGVLTGKAVSLPLPEYPAAAKAVRAAGAVSVQVTIDENGDVIAASTVSGHPLLRAAAVEAARMAKFSPTLLDGNPVKVSGVLVYNFVAPDGGHN